jgi:hypothetical protein
MRPRLGTDRLEERRRLLAPARGTVFDEVERRGSGSPITAPKALPEFGSVLSPDGW